MSTLTVDPAVRVQQLMREEDSKQPAVKSERNGAGPKQQAAEKGQFSEEMLQTAVDQANETMKTYHTNLRFEMHEDSGEYFVKVVNAENDEVIREIPPEKVLDMVAYFKKMIGIIVDEIV